MALDPNIPLQAGQGLAVQPFNPVATLTQIENIKSLREQREALADERRQQAQALIQKAQDTAAVNQALQQTNGDLLGAGDLLTQAGKGTLGQTLIAQHSEQAKKAADALESQNKAAQAHLDMASNVIATMGDSPEHYEAGRQFISQLVQGDGQLKQWFDSVAPQNADPSQIGGIVANLTAATTDAKQRATQQATSVENFLKGDYDTSLSSALLAQPQAGRPQVLAMAAQLAPSKSVRDALLAKWAPIINDDAAIAEAGKKPHEIAEEQNAAATNARVAANEAANLAVRRGELAVSQAREAREGAAAAKANEPPPTVEPGTPDFKVAQDLAYGRMTPSFFRTLQAYNRDAGKKAAIYAKAAELNPAFNEADFERGFKFISSPRIASQLASLDNVESGVPDLLKASDAATRTGSPLLNKALVPAAGLIFGNKKYTNWDTARTAFADELSGALGYGSATDMSREMGFNMTDKNLSPEAFRSGVQDILIPFVERKRASLLKQGSVYGQSSNNSGVAQPTKPTLVYDPKTGTFKAGGGD